MDLPALLLTLGTLLFLTLPGYVLLRGFRVPPIVALVAAPAILAGVITPLTIVGEGTRWVTGAGWATVVWVVAGLMTIIGGLLWWRSPRLPEEKKEPCRLLMGVALGATVLACLVTLYQVLDGMGGLDVPLQRRDSVSHYNAIAGIFNEWGTVHPLETRGWMIGATGSVSFYPSTYHALAAAIPVDLGVVAGNIMATVTALIWTIGLTGLARVLLPAYPGAWIAAPLLSLLTISFPFIPMFRQGQWPYGFAFALVPGLVALMVYSSRHRSILGWLACAVGVVGVAGSHPSGVAVFVIMLFAAAILELVERIISRIRRKDREARYFPLPVALGLTVGGVVAYVVASKVPAIVEMGSYARPQTPALELTEAMVTFGHFNVNEPFPINPAFGALLLLILGAFVLLIYRPSRAFAVTGLLVYGIMLLTPFDTHLSHVTGALWYGDPERLLGVMTLFTTIAAALAVGWIADKVAPRLQADRDVATMGVSLLVIALALSVNWIDRHHVRHDIIVAGNYHPTNTSPYFVGGPAWTDEDDEVWAQWAEIVGGDTVIADPASGGILLPAMRNIRAVPAVTTIDSLPEHGVVTAWALRDPAPIDPDSSVCVFLRENDVRWMYIDEGIDTRFASYHFRSDRIAHHGVLVASEGQRELWHITDCWV